MHLVNLYKNQDIMLFKESFALEKIDGTSAHISHKPNGLKFFSGGVSHSLFIDLFNQEELAEKLRGLDVIIYGEAYGGKCQGMSATYGKELRFVAFDVKINDMWLNVPQADEFCKECGLEFVDYAKIPTTIEAIDEQRDRDSVQAVRNGMGEGKKREGIVLRPLIEVTGNNGERIMSKHKNDEFMETKTPRKVDPEQLKVLEDAQAVAEEWVTPMRVAHVLDKIDDSSMENMKNIIDAMKEDVKREGEGEIIWSTAVEKSIGKATALAVKDYYKARIQ
jgi:hypothetical protein